MTVNAIDERVSAAGDGNVCKLWWEWERAVPKLKRSVFAMPAKEFKGNQPHVLVLNDLAWKVVVSCRGVDGEFVLVWRRERVKTVHAEPVMPSRPVQTMNHTAFQTAGRKAGLDRLRVQDLRHTFGQRLGDAKVAQEDRASLLGQAMTGMPQHRAIATTARPIEAANHVKEARDRSRLLRVVNG